MSQPPSSTPVAGPESLPRPIWLGRIRPHWRLVVLWLLSRGLMLLIFASPAENVIQGDPFYYHRRLGELATDGLPAVMLEYPVPAVWVLQIPYLLGGGSAIGYVIGFIGGMALLDAAFTWLLWRAGGRRRTAAVDFWLVFVVLVGPLTWFRFDLLPAVLVGGALVFSATHPRVAGVLAAIGAATKLWPALVWPALACRPGRARPRTTIAFWITGIALAGISLLAGGWDRLVSPLTWQSDRGLQIESIVATPLMVARALRPDVWRVELSQYNAYEVVTGPGIGPLLTASTAATAVGLVAILALVGVLLVQLRRAGVTADRVDARGEADTRSDIAWRIGLLVMAVVLVMIVTNKTFSPQYVVWLGGPAAYLLLHCGRTGTRVRTTTALVWTVLVAAALTQFVYPVFYPPLYGEEGHLELATALLAARNLVLCVLTVWVVVLAVRPPLGPGRGAGTSQRRGAAAAQR